MPSEALDEALQPFLEEVTIYPAPTNQIVAPALVIRPGTPWITPQDDGTFCLDHQRYVAVAVAVASSPVDAMRAIYQMGLRVMEHLPNGWRFDSMGSIVLDQSTGTAFLAAPINLSYFDSEGASS